MGFEACCLLFAAAPVEDDEATLVWTPAAAFSSRKGQKAKKKSQDASSDANATANPTKDILGAFEGRDDTTFIGDEEVTLHSYLSSMDDADGIDKEEPDERDGTGADACSNSSSCTSRQSSRNNDEETKNEQETDGASSSSLSAATSSASASVPDVSASAKAAVKEAQRAAAEFERKKRERAIAAEFERRRAERAAEREKHTLEREARQAEARAALLERQRKEKEEADKKRRLASRAAFEERMKEAEELKRKREDAKRRRDQQQAQAPFQPQQYQRHHHHPSSAQSKPGFGGVPNTGQRQYQHVHQQQMHQSHYTQQEQYTSDPQPQPQLQPQTQAWPPSQPQSTSYPTNSAQFRARAAPTSPQTDQQRPYPQKIPSPSTFETSRTPAKMQATATPGAAKSTEEVKRSILITWALEPPNYQQLKPIATMIANLQVVLPPSFGVKSHEYFSKWKPIRYHDICQNEDALKKAVRKCRFFLHPDKLPSNLDELQTFVCKMIWDVMNDAWESHKTGVPV